MRFASKHAMPVLTPNFFAARFAAMTMPSPRLPPPTHTARPCSFSSSAISQLAKKLSPSTWRMRFAGFMSQLKFSPFDPFPKVNDFKIVVHLDTLCPTPSIMPAPVLGAILILI